MSWFIVGAVGVSVVGSMMESSDQNDAIESDAAKFGVRRAGIEAATKESVSNLIANAKVLQESRAQMGHEIEQGQAQVEAQVRVNAAAAGVTGGSVEAVVTQTETNAGKAQHQADRQKKLADDKAQQSLVNTVLNAETQIGVLDTSTTDQTGKHIMAGATGLLKGLSL